MITQITGFRPLICLKPDIQLEQKDDGTFEIVDDTEEGGDTGAQTGAIKFGDIQWDDTNTTASVTVSKTTSDMLELQYKRNEEEWQTVPSGYTITGLKDGDLIMACLFDGTNRGYYATLNVVAPDTTVPSATITLSATSTNTNGSVTATVNQSDDKSGINLAQTKYVYNTIATEIGIDPTKYTDGTFSKNPQDIILNATTVGVYYLHVLSVDNAGNKKETISEAVTVSAITETFTPEDIANEVESGNIDEFYGKEVDYQPSNGDTEVKWQIFYVGTNPNDSSDTANRIYLIADDYISSDYAPDAKDGTEINDTSTYNIWFADILDNNAYSGSRDIAANSLGKSWLSYVNTYPSSTNTNIKAVAYMLDTDAWSTFTDNEGKAEYAIGAPTLDLFCASYNQKYPTKMIQYQANSTGYQLKWSSDSSYDTSVNGLSTSDNLYVITNNDKALATWLASPSADNRANALSIHFSGYLHGNLVNQNPRDGFRPVVCLKPDVQLEQQSNGNFTIVDNEQGGGSTEPQVGAIEFSNLQWNDSNTTASVTVSKTTSGTLELQYKINEGGWTTINSGYTITGLKDGDLVTACLFDGRNRGYYATLNVQSPIPGDVAGLTYKEGDESTGIVATDTAGNEWVWVEVPKSIYTTAKSDTEYTNIYNDMKTYTNSYKSNSYTDTYISNNGNFSNATAYNNEKNRMLKSVYDNGGFWISRYEIGTTNASQSVSEDTTNVTTPVSQQNAYPIVNKTQPQSQQIVRKMNSQANLLFGVQWDLTLRFLQEKGGLSVSQLTSDSTSWGNYYNASFTINRGQYQTSWSSTSWTNATNVSKPSNNSWELTTGAADRNRKMNIYDLAGNVWEWTLEGYYSSYVVYRGGGGSSSGGSYPAGDRDYGITSYYNDYIGLRAALY